MKNNGWKGKPYFPISSHYRSIFGDKVYKIPVTTVDDCPITLKQYTHAVEVFLSHLSPRIAVHRLAAFAPRREELIAPEWTADKMKTHQYIIDHLNKHSIVQGACL